jgi:hypothetical protein
MGKQPNHKALTKLKAELKGDKGARGGLSPLLIIGALVALSIGIYYSASMAFPGRAQSRSAALRSAQPGKPDKVDPSKLSAFEQLQRGMLSGANQPKRCQDSSAKCATVTEAECAAAETKEACCATCHKLTCVDLDEQCFEWAYAGECIDNPAYMKAQCCFSCSPDPDDPCSTDPSKRPDVYKGDLDVFFQRAIDNFPQYKPVVHSRDPWVVSFDDLLSHEETDGIIEAVGGKHGEFLKPSTTAKPVRQANGQIVLTDVPDQIRTSYNAWCQHAGCYNHPVHHSVISRIMEIVGLPPDHSEHMQLLKYSPGQYYRLHHDWIPEQLDAACGPRAFTFFLYLSDVEEGGGTKFPYINQSSGGLTVMPKRGKAVWWAHGKNEDPRQKDDRTHHEAMPVIKGQKMAANYWIHGADFKTSMATGCDGRQRQLKRSKYGSQPRSTGAHDFAK